MSNAHGHIAFGLTDSRGRAVGAAWAVDYYEAAGRGPGLYVLVQATRNGTDYGASQSHVRVADMAGAFAVIARKASDAYKRAARKK